MKVRFYSYHADSFRRLLVPTVDLLIRTQHKRLSLPTVITGCKKEQLPLPAHNLRQRKWGGQIHADAARMLLHQYNRLQADCLQLRDIFPDAMYAESDCIGWLDRHDGKKAALQKSVGLIGTGYRLPLFSYANLCTNFHRRCCDFGRRIALGFREDGNPKTIRSVLCRQHIGERQNQTTRRFPLQCKWACCLQHICAVFCFKNHLCDLRKIRIVIFRYFKGHTADLKASPARTWYSRIGQCKKSCRHQLFWRYTQKLTVCQIVHLGYLIQNIVLDIGEIAQMFQHCDGRIAGKGVRPAGYLPGHILTGFLI